MRRRMAILEAIYAAACWFFGGWPGLIIAVAILGLRRARWARIPTNAYWAVGILLLVASPFAIMAQGLPSGPIAGADFGVKHMVAHALVGSALALLGFAGLLEVTKGSQPSPQLDGPTGRQERDE